MSHRTLEDMSKEELVRELRKLGDVEGRQRTTLDQGDPQRLIHDLQVHQVELEMQNRELREAQELLEVSRGRYADLYDFAPIGYSTLDERACILEINLTGAALFGISREQLIGRPISAIASIHGKEVFQRHARRCFQEKAGSTGEAILSVKGREPVTVLLVSTPSLNADGAVSGCRMAITDISAQKRLEARLRFLADVGELAAAPKDYRGTLAAVARLAVPFLADLCCVDLVEEDESLRRIEAVFADAKKQAALAERVKHVTRAGRGTPQAKVVESGEPLLYEHIQGSALEGIEQDAEQAKAMRAAGVQSKMVVPLIARGRTLGALTFAAAESERRYSGADLTFAEEIARRAAMAMDNARLYALEQRGSRSREDLLAIVSHDLKNPLHAILMNVEFLEDNSKDTEQSKTTNRTQLERIRFGAERMTSLIEDLLDTASIAAGRISVERVPVPAVPLITAVIEALAPLAAAKSLRLESELPVNLPPIFADPMRLQQVFTNLLDNAIKFMPAGGTATVRAELFGDAVRFSVADTGPGISPQDVPHLFDRFWQAQRVAREGTGLGLFIVKGIVDAHGGRVWIDSEVGRGTTFYLMLPVAVRSDRGGER